MQNPIERLAQELDLSLAQLALALDVSYPTMWWLREGMPVSIGPKPRAGLANLGYDPVTMDAEYRLWRAGRQAERVAQVVEARQAAVAR